MLLVELLILCLCIYRSHSTVAYSSSLVAGRQFEASSTCGALGPEQFLGISIPGSTTDPLTCDPSDPATSYPPRHLTDSDDQTFWLSANNVEKVSLTFNFEGFYVLHAVQVQFVSPLPQVAILETSQDFGGSYHVLRYYSEDCGRDFGLPDVAPGSGRVEEVFCTSRFSDNAGQLTYEPLVETGADSADYLHTLSLTNLRLRLEGAGQQLPNVIDPAPLFPMQGQESGYYGVSDIVVSGTCVCGGGFPLPMLQDNGTALCPCDPPLDPPFSCDPPTSGPLCRSCTPGYYLSDNDQCLPCDCSTDGSVNTSTCDPISGQCPCRPGVGGRRCDTCPEGFLGPSRFTLTACVRCFCNGFASGGCEGEEGWYQARVGNMFEDGGELEGFTSPGEVVYDSGGFLEVTAQENSQMLVLSFPPSYLGDKRTAFSQTLSLSLALPSLPDEVRNSASLSSELRGYVEVTSSTSSIDPPLVLLFELKLDAATAGPQALEVAFAASHSTVFRVPYFQRRRPAKDRDIRMALANIRFLRLRLEFPKEVAPPQRAARLHSSSLNFATNNLTSDSTLQPLQNISYVEQCSCPASRTGRLCETCADQYTVDPSFGGEFAHCVRCFCNFRSSFCDPMSGVCFNCTGNSGGEQCEVCEEGFDRVLPITFLPCDVCASGFFEAGNGSCIPCNCNPEGSLSDICDTTTGACTCRRGVVGDKCDSCPVNSTGVFPNCEECDECADQWLERIQPLRVQVLETALVVSGLNLTNQMQDIDIPGLDELLQLAREIAAILNSSNVNVLASDVQTTHELLCDLINTTRGLLARAESLQTQIESAENSSSVILTDLELVTQTLFELETELANVSSQFDSIQVPDDSVRLLEQSRSALERADSAEELVRTNFTSVLSEVQSVLTEFDLLNSSTVEDANDVLSSRVGDFRLRIDALQDFLVDASSQLCGGSGNSTCGECGGVGCGTCGPTPFSSDGDSGTCSGLIVQAAGALNTSEVALVIANSLLADLQFSLDSYQRLLIRVVNVTELAGGFEREAGEIELGAADVLLELQRLISELEVELSVTRVDTEEIGRVVNLTLSLQLDLLVEEFFELLVEINSTIDMFFPANVSEVDLMARANRALERSRRARLLADEVLFNISLLQTQLDSLSEQLNTSTSVADEAETQLGGASESLDSSQVLLGETEGVINTSRSRLTDLRDRLSRLEVLIERNEADLETARSLTEDAVQLADLTELQGNRTLSEFTELATDVIATLQQSEEDLANATSIRNRTCELQETAQGQLLQVENLIRVEQALMVEQEGIRDDIERVANQIEVLDATIRTHISRNTVCLDTGVLQKKKRKRRRSSRLR